MPSLPVSYTLTLQQYANTAVVFGLKQPDGSPVNLAGWTGEAHVRLDHDDAEPLLALTSDPGGGLSIDGETGEVRVDVYFTLTADLDVAALTRRVALWDLLLFDVVLTPTRVVAGPVLFLAGVTR